ncbi:hypothetical protein HMPREF9629_01436 [Peptoanaerobacter stomatis]|uniref:GTPase n=1 Tax=Peptoanaerobacter stomatis TaxID=796937 RepID=G9WZ35_9FIRM|nr:DUF697 domain-containing protein [Peptoanaerobacter stomatis]EHL16180.1 hypothetical protein HMPREF9629_01436 [Peptoanaerobacter stomatis]
MEREFNDEFKKIPLAELNDKAENAVAVAVAAAGATAFIPIPFADAPALIAEQVVLMGSICSIYEIDLGKDGLKMLVTTALMAGGATIVGKTIFGNLLKIIPVIGTISGSLLSGATAGTVTYAMGMAFIELCKMVKLGKLSEYDMVSNKGKNVMNEQFKAWMNSSKK